MAIKGSGFIEKVKAELTSAFQMADMGPISFYLGLKVERDREQRTIKLSQPAYIEKILRKFFLDQANPSNIPMRESAQLLPNDSTTQATDSEREKYQGMTGSLMFSMVETRLDIAFATSVASRFAKNPSHLHTEAVKTILKYLKGTKDRGIVYGQGTLTIEGYSDSDWAGDKDSRKSTSGYIFMLNGGPVSWCSKRQPTVALSSTEAEYIALTLAAKEATWLRLLLTELGLLKAEDKHAKINVSERNSSVQTLKDDIRARGEEEFSTSSESQTVNAFPTSSESRAANTLFEPIVIDESTDPISMKGDNQGSISLAHNPVFHARTKHIDIQHHYIRDEVVVGRIDLTYVPTAEMIADGLTKLLTHAKFHEFVKQMRMS